VCVCVCVSIDCHRLGYNCAVTYLFGELLLAGAELADGQSAIEDMSVRGMCSPIILRSLSTLYSSNHCQTDHTR